MHKNAQEFLALLNPQIKNVLSILLKNYEVICVGGAVRDFFLSSLATTSSATAFQSQKAHNLKDIDIELRPKGLMKADQALAQLNDFIEIIKKLGYSTRILPFFVLRVLVSETVLEISFPLIEKYDQRKESFSHEDFSAELSMDLDYVSSFKRRDLTINAIGLSLDEDFSLAIIDPFCGLKDLEQKVLRACDYESFFRDPVRLLRLIRFKEKFKMKFDEFLEKNLSKFNLLHLSSYYLVSEAIKSDFFIFLNEFFLCIKQYKILVSRTLQDFEFFILDPTFIKEYPLIVSPQDASIFYLLNTKEDDEKTILSFEKIADALSLKKNLVLLSLSLKGLFLGLDRSLSVGDLKEKLREIVSSNFEEVRDDKLLVFVEGFYRITKQLLELFPKVEYFIGPSLNLYFKFFYNLVYLMPLQGKELFELERTQRVVKKDFYTRLGLYCHLKVVFKV